MRGLDVKDMPSDLLDIVLRLSMLESKFDITSSLVTKRETSTLSQSLVSEACKLAGLSHELARRTASPGSTEARIVSMAHRLEQIDRCLHTFSGHYGDTVQQVMREVVYSLQLSVLKHQFANGQLPMSSAEQSLTHEVEQLKLQLILANQRNKQLVNVEQHEKTVEALHDEMSMLKVEHSAELDESKKDMRMVLKSVKAEEYRLATELTEQISQLKDQLSEQKLNYETEMKKLKECRPDTVSAEDHALLKDKVRDLETCLHEMQEEFEEELYQERRVHLAELDKARSELLKVISKADKAELTTEDQNEQYEAVIRKLKAEQASLQQWIDDIREAHHDEMDALQHERDAALADEVMATQSSLEAMQSAHSIELQQERAKYKEMENKANRLAQVERDLLLQSRENENKDKRIISLENKISSANKKLAKLEMSSANNNNIVDEMKILNHKLAERNKQLVDKFSQEVSKLSSSDKPTSDGQHMTLKSQIEGLKEELRLEQLNKRQLEEHIVSLKADFQHQLLLKEEDVKIESSSSEELLKQRKTTAQTSSSKSSSSAGESPSKPTSSSPSKSGSRTPTGGASSSASRISGKAATRSIPRSIEKTTSSPKKEVDKAYDLSRSKSTPVVDKSVRVTANRRLSNSAEPHRSIPVLDTNDRGFIKYQKSGGIPLATRMRKFT
ncbi:hypothetical protein EB796_020966 [Bugula neritina]|uniref:Uncharacterized protein n=1 Tax=Bugula neritina TaxID=10212 RepID=A0A7J7J4Y1_BUGNE|nr:hypothetical protein EB796_020966 [Bugula neritina]